MNQQNRQSLKPKDASEASNTKLFTNLIPKTLKELAEIQSRGRQMGLKKIQRYDPYAVPTPKSMTEEEKKEEARQRKKDIKDNKQLIHYSDYYYDDTYEYRHVLIPEGLRRWLPRRRLLSEAECLDLGITQSTGWMHYMVYAPEPYIMLFRREKFFLKKHGLEHVRVREEIAGTEQAQPTQAQPTQAQPTQTQPTQTQPTQTQPTQTQPTQAQPTQAQPTQEQPAKIQPTKLQLTKLQPTNVQTRQVQQRQPTQIKTTQLKTTQVKTIQVQTTQAALTLENPFLSEQEQPLADPAPVASEIAPPIRHSLRLTRSSATIDRIIK
ncbi:cyclin-dependent kinase regulatory subunit-domain-containing protein [Pilaira anomala]|nr:cyclin-dependent kinase regulatory subunit-domain-containing protein [Pilaira anomala]